VSDSVAFEALAPRKVAQEEREKGRMFSRGIVAKVSVYTSRMDSNCGLASKQFLILIQSTNAKRPKIV